MPLCVVCGSPLACTGPDRHDNPLVQTCALKKGALWVHVMDDAGDSVPGIPVEVSEAGAKSTEPTGFARFDPLDSKKYVARVPPLSEKARQTYDDPLIAQGAVFPAPGEVVYLAFTLRRRPELTVKVVQKGNADKVFARADVRISGTEKDGPIGTTELGIAPFGRRSCGPYTVEALLAREDAALFFTRPKDDNVVPGPRQQILVEAEKVNVVELAIDPPEQDLWFHPENDANEVVELRVSVTQTRPDLGHSGKVSVTCKNGVLAYEDKTCDGPAKLLAFDGRLERQSLSVWIKKGVAAQGAVEVAFIDEDTDWLKLARAPRSAALRLRPINVVRVETDPNERTAWFHPLDDAGRVIEVVFAVTQTDPTQGHSGRLTVTCAGTLVCYEDSGCSTPAKELTIPTGQAHATKSVWVKKASAASGTITVALRDDKREGVLLLGPATAALTIEEINVITPVITGDELALVNRNDAAHPTSLSAITVDVVESRPGQTCGDLRITVTYGAQLACYAGANPWASGTVLKREDLPKALLVSGANAGSPQIHAVASSASGATSPAWTFGPNADHDVHVEALDLDAYEFRDGRSIVDLNYMATRVGAARTRELHAANANVFTNGRLVLTKPSAAFWAKASHVTLAVHGAVQVYSDQAATVAKASVQQADFLGANELELWVKTTAGVPMDGAWPGWVAGPAVQRLPTKDITTCHVTCGATLLAGAKQLVNGDIMELDTFGFDKYLDREVGNGCRARLAGGLANVNNDVAHSRAGGHYYYDCISAVHNNKNHPNNGGLLFNQFLAAVGAPLPGPVLPGVVNAARAQLGLTFIDNHLQNNHAIVLVPATQALIRPYLLQCINAGGGHGFGFNNNFGVPGVHAEVLAVNELLAAGVAQAEISVATYKLVNIGGIRGQRFVACPNCRGILWNAVRVITL